MGRIFKTNQLLGISGLLLLLVIGGYVFLFLQIHSKNVSASAILSRIEQLQNRNSQFNDLSDVLADIQEDQSELNSYFVDGEAIVNFLEDIEEIGNDSGAKAEVRSLDENETDDENIRILTLNLVASGNWEDVYHFLALIQSYPVKATFERVHITSESDDSEEGTQSTEWTVVINMKVLELTK